MITKTDIDKYFIAEKQTSLLLIILSITAIVVALVCWFVWKTQFCKGVTIALSVLALVQFIFSYKNYLSYDKQRINAVYAFDMNPTEIKLKETPRAMQYLKATQTKRYVYMALFIVGAIMFFYFKSKMDKHFLVGLGFATLLFTFILISIHYFSEKKTAHYTAQLKQTFS
jgi:hypothetical protein